VLVDPEAAGAKAAGVPHAINYFVPSWDGRTLAYGISAGGSEQRVAAPDGHRQRQALRAPIPRVRRALVSWSPDSRYLAFNQLRELPAGAPETETYLDTTVLLLDRRRQQARRAPRAVFGPLVNPLKLDRLDVGELLFAPTALHGGPHHRHHGARRPAVRGAGGRAGCGRDPVAAIVARPADKITGCSCAARRLLPAHLCRRAARPCASRWRCRDGRLADARVRGAEPTRRAARTSASPRRDGTPRCSEGFNTRVWRHATRHRTGHRRGTGPGRLDLHRDRLDPARQEAWLSTSSWTDPSRVLAVGPAAAARHRAAPQPVARPARRSWR
jgi:hypothetical protein